MPSVPGSSGLPPTGGFDAHSLQDNNPFKKGLIEEQKQEQQRTPAAQRNAGDKKARRALYNAAEPSTSTQARPPGIDKGKRRAEETEQVHVESNSSNKRPVPPRRSNKRPPSKPIAPKVTFGAPQVQETLGPKPRPEQPSLDLPGRLERIAAPAQNEAQAKAKADIKRVFEELANNLENPDPNSPSMETLLASVPRELGKILRNARAAIRDGIYRVDPRTAQGRRAERALHNQYHNLAGLTETLSGLAEDLSEDPNVDPIELAEDCRVLAEAMDNPELLRALLDSLQQASQAGPENETQIPMQGDQRHDTPVEPTPASSSHHVSDASNSDNDDDDVNSDVDDDIHSRPDEDGYQPDYGHHGGDPEWQPPDPLAPEPPPNPERRHTTSAPNSGGKVNIPGLGEIDIEKTTQEDITRKRAELNIQAMHAAYFATLLHITAKTLDKLNNAAIAAF